MGIRQINNHAKLTSYTVIGRQLHQSLLKVLSGGGGGGGGGWLNGVLEDDCIAQVI